MSSSKRNGSPRVATIGGERWGIAPGVKLKQAGLDDLVLFEAGEGIVGTWRLNTYPEPESATVA